LKEEGAEKDEITDAEGELEDLLQARQEGEEGATPIAGFTPTEIDPVTGKPAPGSGWLQYDFDPESEALKLGPLTPNLGFNLGLSRVSGDPHDPGYAPTGWTKITIPTNGLWGSPYSF